MAKLNYDESGVESVLAQLRGASAHLDSTHAELSNAVAKIQNANGIRYISGLEFADILATPDECQNYIKEQIELINARVEKIKEYNEDIDSSNIFQRCGATILHALTNVVEGVATAGEQITDGIASGVAWILGAVDKEAQASIANYVEKDHVGSFFDEQYSTGALSAVNKYSYMSANGTAATIFKCVGIGAGYMLAAAAGGAAVGAVSSAAAGTSITSGMVAGASAAKSSLAVAAAITGVGGVGSGTQAGLQQGMEFNDAFGKGVKTGLIQAGTVVAVNYAVKGIAKLVSNAKNTFTSTSNSTSLANVADDTMNATGSSGNAAGVSNVGDDVMTATSSSGNAAAASNAGYKGYTSLDQVWDDIVSGKLTDKAVIKDIVKNGVGVTDSGVGHDFLSDAMNFLKGKTTSPSGSWSGVAVTAPNVTTAATTFTSAVNSVDDAVISVADDAVASVADDAVASVADDAVSSVVSTNSSSVLSTVDDVPSAVLAVVDDAPSTALAVVDDVSSTALAVVDDVPSTALAVVDDVPSTALAVVDDVPSTALAIVDDVPSTALAVVDDVPSTALAVVDDVPSTALAVVDDVPSTALAVVDDVPSTALAVVDDVPTAIAVADDVPTAIAVADDVPTAIAVVDDVPTAIAVVDDVVPSPVSTPVIPNVADDVIYLGFPQEDVTPSADPITILDPLTDITDVPTDPVVPETTPDIVEPDPVVPDPTPVVPDPVDPTPVVPEPDPEPVTPDIPEDIEEYVPIPNTSVVGANNFDSYMIPAAVGAVAGAIAGLAGKSVHKNFDSYKEEKNSQDEEDNDYYKEKEEEKEIL